MDIIKIQLFRRLGLALLCVGVGFGLLGGWLEVAAQKTITVCAADCDFEKIQQAIDAASAGDTIDVKAGTYQENLTMRNKQELTLQGAGRDVVTLDGSFGQQQQEVIPGINILDSQKITIRGFKIVKSRRGLNATSTTALLLEENSFEGNLRAGIRLVNTEAQIKNNVIQSTQVDLDETNGVGIAINGQSKAMIEQTTITDSAFVGISVLDGSNVTIDGNTINRNGEAGVWVEGSAAQATITNNRITESRPGPQKRNQGIGIAVFGSGRATIRKNTITDNEDAGIHFGQNSRGTIEDNDITGNRWWGVSLLQFAEVTIINNRINRNRPNLQGRFGRGIRIQEDARATIRDNQIIGNAHYGVVLFQRAQATLVNNIISENTLGGLGIGAEDAQGETVKAEASNNTIQNNRGCGVWADNDPGITITGQGNTITGNGGGSLCGAMNKFPTGFGGGR